MDLILSDENRVEAVRAGLNRFDRDRLHTVVQQEAVCDNDSFFGFVGAGADSLGEGYVTFFETSFK